MLIKIAVAILSDKYTMGVEENQILFPKIRHFHGFWNRNFRILEIITGDTGKIACCKKTLLAKMGFSGYDDREVMDHASDRKEY